MEDFFMDVANWIFPVRQTVTQRYLKYFSPSDSAAITFPPAKTFLGALNDIWRREPVTSCFHVHHPVMRHGICTLRTVPYSGSSNSRWLQPVTAKLLEKVRGGSFVKKHQDVITSKKKRKLGIQRQCFVQTSNQGHCICHHIHRSLIDHADGTPNCFQNSDPVMAHCKVGG